MLTIHRWQTCAIKTATSTLSNWIKIKTLTKSITLYSDSHTYKHYFTSHSENAKLMINRLNIYNPKSSKAPHLKALTFPKISSLIEELSLSKSSSMNLPHSKKCPSPITKSPTMDSLLSLKLLKSLEEPKHSPSMAL
jgi:hypothetical protein